MSDSRPWHDDDRFWEQFGAGLVTEGALRRAVEKVEPLIGLLGLRPGDSVLDLCCGPGRFSVELARRGMKVTGVDRTAGYLETARTRTADARLEAEYVLEDMRKFVRPGSFDACINMFSSFGYFEDQDEDRKVARNVFESLKPGGRFVLETMGRETLFHVYERHGWEEQEDGTLVLYDRTPSDDWSWLGQRWIVIRGGERTEHKVWMRMYSAAELVGLLEDARFEKVGIHGSVNGEPYDRNGSRLAVVVRKPVDE